MAGPVSQANRGIAFRKPFGKFFAQPGLRIADFRLVFFHFHPVPQFGRQFNDPRRLDRFLNEILDRRHRTLGIEVPLNQQSIRRHAAMQRTGRGALKIRKVLPANRAQAVQIEVRIPEFERIKSPLNQPDPAAQRLFALKKFQHSTNTPVAIFVLHSGHVRMQVRGAVAQAHDRQGIANQAAMLERAKHLAARMRRHHKQRGGLDFQVRLTPDLPLEFHATMELLQRLELAHNDVSAHLRACAFSSSLASDFPSASFAASHSASISSRGRPLNSRPDSRAKASIARNLRENFAFAFFSAISGSTCKNRARFTAANRKSPISSSIPCWSLSFIAISNSAVSSRIFSMTPSAFCQSKPIRDALRVSWRPSSVAGSERETPSSNDAASPGLSSFSPSSFLARRSSALIRSQFLNTSAESRARVSPKTCGCRRIILS